MSRATFVALALALAPLLASHVLAAQQPPRPHPLGVTTATPADLFGSVASVRSLPGGRVLVNDNRARRLLLLDSTFATARVVLDSSGPAGEACGYVAQHPAEPNALFAFGRMSAITGLETDRGEQALAGC